MRGLVIVCGVVLVCRARPYPRKEQPMSETAMERVARTYHDFAVAVEEMGEVVYQGVEREALKRAAIASGIDHTIEPTAIVLSMASSLQHERDVVRELRRHVRALVAAESRRELAAKFEAEQASR